MHYFELGQVVREARISMAESQASLARQSGLTRTTINQVEAGSCPDLGVRKVVTLLSTLGLELTIQPKANRRRKDFVRMACVSANVSLRESIAPDDLARVFLTGEVPRRFRPHLRVIFEEAPSEVLAGLMKQLGSNRARAQRVEKYAELVAREVGSSSMVET